MKFIILHESHEPAPACRATQPLAASQPAKLLTATGQFLIYFPSIFSLPLPPPPFHPLAAMNPNPVALPFVMLIPSQPPTSLYTQLSPTQFSTTLHNPLGTSDIVIYLNPAVPIPPDYGIVVYSSVASPSSLGIPASAAPEWKLLGAITTTCPSVILRTGFTTDESVTPTSVVNLGISIEPVSTIANLSSAYEPSENRLHIAKQIAMNLYNYMASFTVPGQPKGQMVVPSNVFEMWYSRFEDKYKRDPSFFMKTQD
jgi:hypothetical protein